jgi:hypothetical protein
MLQDHQKSFIFKLWTLWILTVVGLVVVRLVNDYLSFSGYFSYVQVKPVKTTSENIIPPLVTIVIPVVLLLFFGLSRYLLIRNFKKAQPSFYALSFTCFVALRFLLRNYFLGLYDQGQISFLTIELYEYASYIVLMLLDITYTVTFLSMRNQGKLGFLDRQIIPRQK